MSRLDDDGLSLLLVDGNNLLHRIRGARPDAPGLAWLIPRLRASLPPGASAMVMLDGHPDTGEPPRRQVAPDVEFRHSGRVDSDTAILDILAARPFSDRGRTVVITDDRALADRTRRGGGLTRRLDWLRERLEAADRAPAPRGPGTVGLGRPQRLPPVATGRAADAPDHEPWKPGRGATRKRGNPRRGTSPRGKPPA